LHIVFFSKHEFHVFIILLRELFVGHLFIIPRKFHLEVYLRIKFNFLLLFALLSPEDYQQEGVYFRKLSLDQIISILICWNALKFLAFYSLGTFILPHLISFFPFLLS